jgi:pullulanase
LIASNSLKAHQKPYFRLNLNSIKMRIKLFFILMIIGNYLTAQDFSASHRLQGYANIKEDLYFIFDENVYNIQPKTITVTGTFRNWSQELNDVNWQLKKQENGIWWLQIENKDFETVPPLAQFKFRTEAGTWLSPPQGAPNEKAGNLEYMTGYTIPSMTAELRRPKTIWAVIQGMERPLDKSAYRLTDAQGNELEIARVLPNTSTETLIIPAQPLDVTRVYFLEIPERKLKVFCDFDGWFRDTYSDKPLGANISADGKTTAFRIFAPRATGLKLYLYQNPTDEKAYATIEMTKDADGVWEHIASGNLKGVYYDFTVHGATDIGNLFYETKPMHISDPYARVNMDAWGKSRVWEATKPASPLKNGIPKMEDVIAYEVHIQDFTDQLPVDKTLKGTIPAMAMKGLKNDKNQKIGFDYLVDLGINVVHLLPMQEYLHFPDEDWKASFQDDEYMKEQGVSEENYQWGYRTTHCFAVESKYRKKDTEPGAEREQFRDLVQAFHDENIAVIIDIVPNHTGENMAAEDVVFHFNVLDMQYYYRTKNFKHIGGYGNEVKTENRPMVQRWLIDQCLHFIHEFGVDGFRIDLAGQIDQQTLIALKQAIGEDKIVYGEPWIASNDPRYEANPDWDWYKEDSPITFFQDDSRNAYKGPVFELNDKNKDRGWAGGKFEERETVMKSLSAQLKEDKTPLSGITYLDIHDNFTLADQFAKEGFDGRFGVDEDQYKIATTLLYTTLGPIVTHGGSEIMRTKGHAPLREVEKTTKAGYKQYFHGKRDTYNHRTANNFVWSTVGRSKDDAGSYGDFKGMHAFWQGMNEFRLSEYGKVFRIAEQPASDYYQFIAPKQESVLGYIVDGKVLVLLNASDQPFKFEVENLPKGKWKLIANNNAVNIKGVKDKAIFKTLVGGKSQDITVEGLGLKIWILEH